MFNGKYIHLEEILERVHRDFAFEEVFADEAKEWIWDCIGFFGRDEVLVIVPDAEVDIVDNRGLLPGDVYSFIGCRDKLTKTPLLPTTDRYFKKNFVSSTGLGEAIVQGTSVDITTTGIGDNVVTQLDDPTLYMEMVPRTDVNSQSEWTYQLTDGYIFTGISNITLELLYVAFPMWEEDRTPKIPDDPKVIDMVSLFIAEKIAKRLFYQGKLSKQILEDIRTDLDFRVGSAQNRIKIPNEDELESIKNSWLRLTPKPNQWQNGFRELNRGERLNRM